MASPPGPPAASQAAESSIARDRGAGDGESCSSRVEHATAQAVTARAPGAPGAANRCTAVCATDVSGPEARAPRAAGSARTTERLVGCDQALRDIERAGRVEDPTPLARRSGGTDAAIGTCTATAGTIGTVDTGGANGLVVLDRDRSEGHAAPGVQDPAPFARRPCWIVTPEIDTLPPKTWMTRSMSLPSMMVLVAPLPLR